MAVDKKPVKLKKTYKGHRDPQITKDTKVLKKETQSEISRRRYKALTGKDYVSPKKKASKGEVKLGPASGKIKRVAPKKKTKAQLKRERDARTRRQMTNA